MAQDGILCSGGAAAKKQGCALALVTLSLTALPAAQPREMAQLQMTPEPREYSNSNGGTAASNF